MWRAENYRPDPLVVNACSWARQQGLRNQDFSAVRRGERVEIIDTRFDMAVRIAWVLPQSQAGRSCIIERV